MSIPFVGLFTRSGGLNSAIAKQVKLLNLKAVKRVTVKFDPFDESAKSAREYLSCVSSPRVNGTNTNCIIKTDIVCNRAKPALSFQFIPAIQEAEKVKTLTIESENLSLLELLRLTNQQVTLRAPKDDPVSGIKTKSAKKTGGGGKKK